LSIAWYIQTKSKLNPKARKDENTIGVIRDRTSKRETQHDVEQKRSQGKQ